MLVILPKAPALNGLRGVPSVESLSAALSRRKKKISDLAKSPVATEGEQGSLVSWIMLDAALSVFEQQTLIRKGLQLLLAEKPEEIAVAVFGPAPQRRRAAELAVFSSWANGVRLPERKKQSDAVPLKRVRLYGYRAPDGFARQRAVAEGDRKSVV